MEPIQLDVKTRVLFNDMTADEIALFKGGPEHWGDADERADRGARYLDRVDPTWYLKVKVNRLELSSVCSCVLGQLYAEDSTKACGALNAWYASNPGRAIPPDFVDAAGTALGAQVHFDGFSYGLAALGLKDDNYSPASVFYGFDADADDDVNYGVLTECWQEQINTRLADVENECGYAYKGIAGTTVTCVRTYGHDGDHD